MTRLAIAVLVFLAACLLPAMATAQDGESRSLRDITGIERPDELARESIFSWLAGAGLLLLLFLAVASSWMLLWRRRRRSRLPADVWAKHELARIAGLDLGNKGKGERHHYLVSNVLRSYIEKRFGLPARRQTTPEFLRDLFQEPRIPAEQCKLLEAFLLSCDLGKFAGVQSSEEQCLAVTRQALAFVESTSNGALRRHS